MKLHLINISAALSVIALSFSGLNAQRTGTTFQLGWVEFETLTTGANSTNVNDSTPDVETSGGFLSGAVGNAASPANNGGFGINANALTGLNDADFGDSSGNGFAHGVTTTGNNAVKFQTNDNKQRLDFRITNTSRTHTFRLERIHFDARVGNDNSNETFQLLYLNGNGTAFDNNLINSGTGTEVSNRREIANETLAVGTSQQDISIAAAIGAAGTLAPGASAGFRILWTGSAAGGAQSQLDNLAFSGTFLVPTVEVTISGGMGTDGTRTPLRIELPRDVTFTNVPTGRDQYGFVLIGAAQGNTVDTREEHTGTMAWNGTGDNSGITGFMGFRHRVGDPTLDDIIVTWGEGAGSNQPQTSSTMTLSAGHRSTNFPIFGSPITGTGRYVIRMMDINLRLIGDPGTEVPTPPPTVEVTISGGERTAPLRIELPRDVTFTNVPTGQETYGFVLIGAAEGNTVTTGDRHTGTMAWNGTGDDAGSASFIGFLEGDGDPTLDDITVRWITVGNQPQTSSTMTLSAGHRSSDFSLPGSVITGTGRYVIRMIDFELRFIGDAGVQPTAITFVEFDSATREVTLRWRDTGGSYSIQASNDLDWSAPTPITVNGETDLGDEIEYQFEDTNATGATRFWRVLSE